MSAWSRRVVKLVTRGLLGLVLLSEQSEATEPESRLEGWVRLASGQPAAGVQVRLFDLTDPRRSVGTTTDEEGYFALAALRLADARPQGFALLQNYPNPFNPSTIIPYQLPAPTHVRLEVFNVLGQHVATLIDREQPVGWHTATWHGTDAAGRAVAAGLYLYRISGIGLSETRRMVLVDGPVSAPGAAVAAEPPTSLVAFKPTYGLTVSGRDVVTHVDPDFQADVGPVEIVVEARATSPTAMKVTTSDRIWGDVDANGQVDIYDALLVGMYSLDPTIAIPNDGDISLGDVNRDGLIDITDAYLIATYSVNPTDPSLPARIGTLAIKGKMYWVDASRNGATIQRANLDGSQIEEIV
ncbi:MAG: T9SS type A sorting domain-containing protein, partial [Gemmatimonadetes bacterium]|nr:T9SS type A sorting domain-containing protein [Gemmatimonadota bacterium]